MKRVQILAALVVVLAAAFFYTLTWVYGEKPDEIYYLDQDIKLKNEELITAQILSNQLDRVYKLFEVNLADDRDDAVAKNDPRAFANDLTSTLDSLGITTVSMRPKPYFVSKGAVEYPYDLEIRCNYKQLGILMSEFESSTKLIKVDEFHVKNGVERLKNASDESRLEQQDVELKISTLTLLKD